jgi:signal-transduction protein with cAMP-binding, CBS, and nucleotidyltransferase domain
LYSLKDYRYRELVSCAPNTTAYDVALSMEKNRVGSILVNSEKTGVQGIVTRYDLVHYIIVDQKDPRKTKVGEIMHQSPVSVSEDATPLEALQKMLQNKVERIVVRSKDNKVLGIISFEDVAQALESTSIQGVSPEKSKQIFDMVRRLTPSLISRYDGEEKLEMERELNSEVKALLRLLEEAEIALRH